MADWRMRLTLHSDSEHAPITMFIAVSEEQARVIMATPYISAEIGMERAMHGGAGIVEVAGRPLLDFDGDMSIKKP